MNFDELYENIRSGKMSRDEARQQVSLSYIQTTNNYILDHNRQLRNNIPEIIYGEYKTYNQIIEITDKLLQHNSNVIVSRFPHVKLLVEYYETKYPVHYDERIIVVGTMPASGPSVLVISGGAADHPVASEIDLTLKALGINSLLYEDRGIAHPTRVLEAIKTGIENKVKVAIVVAGMEGALASFVASLMPLPIIGVPTSVGYGYMAKETALISMLASCTPNLTVVNIDGGVRAAIVASLIAKG